MRTTQYVMLLLAAGSFTPACGDEEKETGTPSGSVSNTPTAGATEQTNNETGSETDNGILAEAIPNASDTDVAPATASNGDPTATADDAAPTGTPSEEPSVDTTDSSDGPSESQTEDTSASDVRGGRFGQRDDNTTDDPAQDSTTEDPEPAVAVDEPTPEPTSEDTQSGGITPVEMVATCDDGPLDAPLPDCTPTPVPDSGDFYADCVARINQFRWECQCLPPLERWTEGEDCADQQAEYDYGVNEAHAGIQARICENGGNAQNECPGYSPNFGIVDFCLQQMWDEGPGEDFNAHGHYINMSNTSFSQVACGLFTAPNGEIWSVQNFQ